MTRQPTCQELRSRLHEDVDTGLTEAERERRERHFETCSECREALAEWQQLHATIAALPTEIEPDHELWPVVKERLEGETRAVPPMRQLLLAAAVLAAVVGSATTVWWLRDAAGTPPVPQISSPSVAEHPSPTTEADLSRAAGLARYEDHVLGAHRDLVEALGRRQARFEPQLAAALEADVRTLDRAVGEIRIALQNDPESSRLNLLLAATYQREVDLLRRLHRI